MMNQTRVSDRPTLVRFASSPRPAPPRSRLPDACLAFGLLMFGSVMTLAYEDFIPVFGARFAFDMTFGLLLLLLSPIVALIAGLIIWSEKRWSGGTFEGVGFTAAGFVLVLLSAAMWLGYPYIRIMSF